MTIDANAHVPPVTRFSIPAADPVTLNIQFAEAQIPQGNSPDFLAELRHLIASSARFAPADIVWIECGKICVQSPTDVQRLRSWDALCVYLRSDASRLLLARRRRRDESGPVPIFIKTLTGQTIALDVHLTDSIESVKKKIVEKQAVPLDHQRLIFDGVKLTDNLTLTNCGIQKMSTLHLMMRIRGGNGDM